MKNLTLPCLRAVVGDWVYYSSVMTAKQIAECITTAQLTSIESKINVYSL